MKNFPMLTGTKGSRKTMLILVAICCASVIAAFFIGVSGNWPGILLCYIAATALILAFVHNWREKKNFLTLSGASLIGFPLFVLLHNLFYGLGEMAADIVVLGYLLRFLHAVFFLIAIMVCPPGFLIGAVGSIVIYLRKRKIQDETP